jgi:hypothetical protein
MNRPSNSLNVAFGPASNNTIVRFQVNSYLCDRKLCQDLVHHNNHKDLRASLAA